MIIAAVGLAVFLAACAVGAGLGRILDRAGAWAMRGDDEFLDMMRRGRQAEGPRRDRAGPRR